MARSQALVCLFCVLVGCLRAQGEQQRSCSMVLCLWMPRQKQQHHSAERASAHRGSAGSQNVESSRFCIMQVLQIIGQHTSLLQQPTQRQQVSPLHTAAMCQQSAAMTVAAVFIHPRLKQQ